MKEESRKQSVMTFIERFASWCQSYLIWVTNGQHRFVLTRVQLGTAHHLVAFPNMNKYPTSVTPCPCDGVLTQSTQHVILFCGFM